MSEAPLSMGFPRQERRRELPFLPPGDLQDAGTEALWAGSPDRVTEELWMRVHHLL